MNYPKEILVKDYFDIHNYYANIYGKDRTIILMQVGSFHEAYSTINNNFSTENNNIDEYGLNLILLADQLNIICTKKNSNLPISKSNPRMMGFPISVVQNYIDKLIDLNYTIVLIDQVSEPPNPKREVTAIYSPATYIDKQNLNSKSFYLLSIVIDKIKNNVPAIDALHGPIQNKINLNAGNNYQLCIGMATYDLTTGDGAVYETYSKSSDILLGLDDALRFIEKYPPREIILENKLNDNEIIANMKIEDILLYLNIDIKKTYKISSTQIKQQEKISYQELLFNKIYNIKTNLNIIDYLGLQFYNWSRLSLVILLDYVICHQPKLLEFLKIPKYYTSNKYLYLGNRSLEQLDIINSHQETNLFNIINNTKTAMGKRLLYSNLTSPLIDATLINERYNAIEKILENNYENKILNYLDDIYDLDKIIRKVEINIINPHEIYQLYISLLKITKLIIFLKKKNLLKIFNIELIDIDKYNNILKWIETTFILDKINNFNFNNNNISDNNFSFYNEKIHPDIDNIQLQINDSQNFIDNLSKTLDTFIEDKYKNNQENKPLINIKYNDKDGHYLLLTNRRCEILKKNLSKHKIINVGLYELDINELEFIPLPKSLNTKIQCNKIKNISNDLISLKNNMLKILKYNFNEDIKFLLNNSNDLYNCSKKIAYIDFINSGAICAINNHYTKPIINEKIKSYFIAKELRHPIIEKISTNTNYIPHDIELGFETKQDGILLYGINSSGKSTLMKSIGINIILAQIGYYTASTYFEYSPYFSLMTRINGNDNMFRGLSSFMVELMELMAILKRNNSNTLVIGDELMKSTELRSGIVIICYMLETLTKSNTSFITATHLHQITTLESVTKLDRVKSKHLKITYNENEDMLIYDRQLSDGQGETFYGLQVAKYLMKDNYFNERTTKILNEYDEIDIKKSKYNSEIYLENCNICKSKKNLETHHIIWQMNFDKNDINKNKFYLQKNNKSNLVCLCNKCHDMVHNNKIIINGWIETSDGINLDYKKIDKQEIETKCNLDKYTIELVDYILKLKNKINDPKIARFKIAEKFNKKVSTTTILKYWN
jgi:DNA mismatch repair protein MutS